MELIEEQTLITKIVRQGDREVIVTPAEFPFNWKMLKAEIQHELNMPVENHFKVLLNRKIVCYIKGGK